MIVLLPIILFILVYLPYVFLIPGGDGGAEFRTAYDLFHGHYFTSTNIYHPPLKAALFALFFKLFGVWSYGFVGLIMGSIGIYALFHLVKMLFDTKTAMLSSCLFALSGLYVVTAQFGMIDFLLTVFILVGLLLYSKQHYWWYGLVAALAVLTKETGIFFAISVFIVELMQRKRNLLPLILPFIAMLGWLFFLAFTGRHLWNAYNFSETQSHGSLYTMFYNVLTLHFLNPYAYENWMHLLIFNFNWLFTVLAVMAIRYVSLEKHKKTFYVIGIFSGIFFIMVLSFQTWTINRYVLPLLSFLYMLAAYGALKLRHTTFWVTFLISIALLSLSYSIDPLSNTIWPRRTVLNETFYLKEELDGGDGLTYNLQYAAALRERNELVQQNRCDVPPLLSLDPIVLRMLHVTHCQ